MSIVLLLQANSLHIPLQDQSVHMICTSPPYYGLRQYEGIDATAGIGLEQVHDCGAWTRGEAPLQEPATCKLRMVGTECHRVLRPDGTVWLNLGDAYTSGNRQGHGTRQGYLQQTNRGMNGTHDPPRAPQPMDLKAKNLLGMPWRVALALQADGWTLRADCIWSKPNAMPDSVRDRPNARA